MAEIEKKNTQILFELNKQHEKELIDIEKQNLEEYNKKEEE